MLKEELLKLHNTSTTNKRIREVDANKVKNNEMKVSEFVNMYYHTFDCASQAKLLLLNSQLISTATLNAVHFGCKLQKISSFRPQSAATHATVIKHNDVSRPSTAKFVINKNVYDRLYEPRKRNFKRKKSIDEHDNKYIGFMESLRQF
tara:strand:- start:361 stop:804 length:444 start_codon:yes stop_codon:yes gene_type:complete